VLAFNGTLYLTTLANSKIDGIRPLHGRERQRRRGQHTLKIDVSDVIDLGTGQLDPAGALAASAGELPNAPAIHVNGDAGDTLTIRRRLAERDGPGNVPAGYALYVHDSPGGATAADAYVLVQTAVKVRPAEEQRRERLSARASLSLSLSPRGGSRRQATGGCPGCPLSRA
jgi:hypothetical protein